MLIRFFQFALITILLGLMVGCNLPLLGLPNSEKVKADLIGLKITRGSWSWQFASLSEYEKFEIVENKTSGNITEIKANVVLKAINSGNRYAGTLLIVYRKEGNEWKLVSFTDNETLNKITTAP